MRSCEWIGMRFVILVKRCTLIFPLHRPKKSFWSMVNALVRTPIPGFAHIVLRGDEGLRYAGAQTFLDCEWLWQSLAGTLNLSPRVLQDSLRLQIAGKVIPSFDAHVPLDHDCPFFTATFIGGLVGGKGGFGTLLRGKGARASRTTNFESSRDLQGRRMRNAKAPERIKNWIQKKAHERAIIQAVGGHDKFLGKQMSAQDVLKLYKIEISRDVFNPFEDVEDVVDQGKEKLREEAAIAAVEAINMHNESPSLLDELRDNSLESITHRQANDEKMQAYLDVLDDF
eukprot:Blabericola_migrator_1__3286@NODE_1969_length_3487_cov_118_792982_g1253_i0_p1_GENE_NODE_1969_length_3487_cov_118_792982_g1253_i0NODE_1969_length_3487_cov_118_792982_g1253_i0_p1_ORF_typecomplete_len284_score28_22Sde2_N_Ubi/PF13019_6/1_6e21_NODE_1969_length_3487_cov_118_792982_g1253_i026363487